MPIYYLRALRVSGNSKILKAFTRSAVIDRPRLSTRKPRSLTFRYPTNDLDGEIAIFLLTNSLKIRRRCFLYSSNESEKIIISLIKAL